MTSLSAQAAPEAESLQTASTSEAESALHQGVPAVLEGKAKLAVEQALRKAVDKTKVMLLCAILVLSVCSCICDTSFCHHAWHVYDLNIVGVEHRAACSHLWHLRQGHVSIC